LTPELSKQAGRRWHGLLFAAALLSAAVVFAEEERTLAAVAKLPLLTLDGDAISAEDTPLLSPPAGGLVVLFWSLYQPESRRALRDVDLLSRAVAEQGARTAFLAVEVPEYRERPESVAEFLERARVRLPVVMDPEGKVFRGVASAIAIREARTPIVLVLSETDVFLAESGWDGEAQKALTAAVARAQAREVDDR
jgi:hypothetical protein